MYTSFSSHPLQLIVDSALPGYYIDGRTYFTPSHPVLSNIMSCIYKQLQDGNQDVWHMYEAALTSKHWDIKPHWTKHPQFPSLLFCRAWIAKCSVMAKTQILVGLLAQTLKVGPYKLAVSVTAGCWSDPGWSLIVPLPVPEPEMLHLLLHPSQMLVGH